MKITELFIKYNEQIYRFILSRTGYSKELAEDLTSEVFIKIIKNQEAIKEKVRYEKSWIYSIARNHIIDHYRKRKIATVDIGVVPEELISQEDRNLKDLVDSEKLQGILKCLERLKPNEQEVIRLRYIGELTPKEISLVIEKSYAATRKLLSRSVNKLKEIIKNEGIQKIQNKTK